MANSIFTFGILATVFAYVTEFSGIIFSVQNKKRILACRKMGGQVTSKTKAAQIISMVSFIVGIVMSTILVAFICYVVVVFGCYGCSACSLWGLESTGMMF